MYKEILGALQCPLCKAKFQMQVHFVEDEEIIEGTLICANNHRYAVHRGVIDFCSEEQDGFNQWSEFLKETDYEELDRKVEAEKPEKEKEQQKIHLESIVSEAVKLEKGCIVDIASGRGMLLTKLAEVVDQSVHLIATDLSFDILMYDRMKIKKNNPDARISYIACDATAMPLEAGIADLTVSFYGVANMIGIVEKGIKEAFRVTAPNGKFLNAFLVIKEESKGFEAVKRICVENNMAGAERNYLDEEMRQLHGRHFAEVTAHVVIEDIYENVENKLDILPYPGEWFAYVTYEGGK